MAISKKVAEKRAKRGRSFEPGATNQKIDEVQAFKRLFDIIKEYRSFQPDEFVNLQSPERLSESLALEQHGGEENWSRIFNWASLYLKYSVRTDHPRFLNRMWSGANLPSIVGEIIAAVSNTSAGTFESAPVSTLMEKYMINQTLELVGFPHGEGIMTTGSSNANMIAMMAARNHVNDSIKQKGLFGSNELFGFVSRDAHYSMDKAANILGIGAEHLIKTPVDDCGRIDTQVLKQQIEDCERAGGMPFFVGATAGTTVRGAYDSIEDLLKLRDKYNFWLHVDGAWGGAAIFSENLKARFLPHIDDVDSFTWDFHKMAGTALVCNVLLFKQGGLLMASLPAGDTSYIYGKDNQSDSMDLGTISLQCGRRVDSLKWFLDWKFYGREGLARRVESYFELCEFAEDLIRQSPELELVAPRESFNLCFRFVVPPGAVANEFNERLRKELHQKQVGLIGSGYIDGQYCLRLLIANPGVAESELVLFFKELVNTGNKLLGEIWTI